MFCQAGLPFSASEKFVFQGSDNKSIWEDLLEVSDSGFHGEQTKMFGITRVLGTQKNTSIIECMNRKRVLELV